jgi:hypothetical protein
LLQFVFLSGSILVSKSKYERQAARKRRLAQKRQKNKPQKIRGQMQRHKAVSSKKQGDRKGGTQVIRKHHAVFPLSPTTKGAFNFLSLQFSNLFTFSNLFGASPREQNDLYITIFELVQSRLRQHRKINA